jgi:gliding motility-associated-like protein
LLLTDKSFFVRTNTNDLVSKWNWQVNTTNNYISKDQNVVLKSGFNNVKLNVESNFGCKSNVLDTTVVVYQKPFMNLSISDSCINKRITFHVFDTTNSVINNWAWNFGNGFYKTNHTFTTFYPKVQNIPIGIIGRTPFGCLDTINRNFRTYDNIAFAGKDTIAAFDQPVQLDANGYPNQRYFWTPSIGLSNDTIVNPIALNKNETTYQLYSITKEGCENNSKINIKRYVGPALYVSTAFTPNDDNLNDIIYVFPVGIKKFLHFSIYNRLGNLVFATTDYSKGWDGKYKGVLQTNNVFIAVAEAIDYRGNSIKYKGTITVL